ncbi:MAG: arsenate reductase family protein [Sphaerochaeta sp.]|uniref:arsenate reductase family protein n=1 Tax=Sphaerochaeta sp. TaxID=1972642 RepID=UPI0029776FCA|nr:arsenate reductase family protein [Sphaerochaeta sp.]MDD3928564.1 arsenate reductase family protein [Sphaerochaeta sp.]
MTIFCYPRCSTCAKAIAFLDAKGLSYTYRDIKLNRPSKEELRSLFQRSGLELRRFFNTSGQLYRSMELKTKLSSLSEDEMLQLLASDGMLVKRPLLVTEKTVLVGFDEKKWEALLS